MSAFLRVDVGVFIEQQLNDLYVTAYCCSLESIAVMASLRIDVGA
jgi:hypothetical protein